MEKYACPHNNPVLQAAPGNYMQSHAHKSLKLCSAYTCQSVVGHIYSMKPMIRAPGVLCSPSISRRNRPTAAGSTAWGLASNRQQQVLASSLTLPVSVFEAKQNDINTFNPHYLAKHHKSISSVHCYHPSGNQELSHVTDAEDSQRVWEVRRRLDILVTWTTTVKV